jgi:hypothetical protein
VVANERLPTYNLTDISLVPNSSLIEQARPSLDYLPTILERWHAPGTKKTLIDLYRLRQDRTGFKQLFYKSSPQENVTGISVSGLRLFWTGQFKAALSRPARCG